MEVYARQPLPPPDLVYGRPHHPPGESGSSSGRASHYVKAARIPNARTSLGEIKMSVMLIAGLFTQTSDSAKEEESCKQGRWDFDCTGERPMYTTAPVTVSNLRLLNHLT